MNYPVEEDKCNCHYTFLVYSTYHSAKRYGSWCVVIDGDEIDEKS